MSYVVYRDCPNRPRQYLRRIVGQYTLWNEDIALAQRFDQRRAEAWATACKLRAMGVNPQRQVIETPGQYDILEVGL